MKVSKHLDIFSASRIFHAFHSQFLFVYVDVHFEEKLKYLVPHLEVYDNMYKHK